MIQANNTVSALEGCNNTVHYGTEIDTMFMFHGLYFYRGLL